MLSAAAVRRMDIARCLALYHTRCMQSDWMIGGCVRRHNISELRLLGCGTCAKHVDRSFVRAGLKEERCFFMQNALGFKADMDAARLPPAILHESKLLLTAQTRRNEKHG